MSQRPTAKRSPSILVTDARSTNHKSAPFAGTAYNNSLRQQQNQHNSSSSSSSAFSYSYSSERNSGQGGNSRMSKKRSNSKFSDISISNLLSDVSDIPSGRREERQSSGSLQYPTLARERRVLSKPFQALPSRTSKTSQKLVYIPDDDDADEEHDKQAEGPGRHVRFVQDPRSVPISPHQAPSASNRAARKPSSSSRSKAERMSKEKRGRNLSRITAYLVSEGFDLTQSWNFLEDTHDISPRIYDETLYCPYVLPLLSGKEGFRVKSNQSMKDSEGETYIERLIDSSEKRDHHYEYYSGVETPEDANNNYEIDRPMPIVPEVTNNLQEMDIGQGETNMGNSQQMEQDMNREADQNNQQNLSNSDQQQIPPNNYNGPFDPSEPQFFAEGTSTTSATTKAALEMSKNHAEMFIFSYGVVVFWNFTEVQEKNILADIAFARYNDNPHLLKKDLVVRPLDENDIETEQFHFEYDAETERPRVFNDMITLRSGDHLIKLTMSHAIAQSTKLSRFESRISPVLYSVSKLPKRLALTGKLGLKREQLIKKSGKLFKLRVDVNLSSNVLDTPEFFWSFEPSLHPLYTAMREYLEIEQRVEVLNDRCKVFLEFIDIVADSIAEKNMTRITYMIITVFFLSLVVSAVEIFIRYMIIDKIKKSFGNSS